MWRIKLARFFACSAGKLTNEIFIGIAQHIQLGMLQLEIYFIQMTEHPCNYFVALFGSFTEFGRVQVHVFKQVVELLFEPTGADAEGGEPQQPRALFNQS